MATKTKAFDCVEMKRRIQRQLVDEYEAHKDQCSTLGSFIREKARNSAEVQAIRTKLGLN
jgi:hypothetical protein